MLNKIVPGVLAASIIVSAGVALAAANPAEQAGKAQQAQAKSAQAQGQQQAQAQAPASAAKTTIAKKEQSVEERCKKAFAEDKEQLAKCNESKGANLPAASAEQPAAADEANAAKSAQEAK